MSEEKEGKTIRVPEDESKPQTPAPTADPEVQRKAENARQILEFCEKHGIGIDDLRGVIENEEPPEEETTVVETVETSDEKTTGNNSGRQIFDFETINITDVIIVVFCGIALLMATYNKFVDIISLIIGGFMGYLGGGARGLLRNTNQQQTTTDTKTTTTRKK